MMNVSLRKISFISACAAILISGVGSSDGANGAELKVAYAHVFGNGTLDTANSRDVVAMAGDNGLYCFKLAFEPKNAVATIANDPTAPDQGLGFIMVALPPTPLFKCSAIPKPDAVVSTSKETTIGGGESSGGHAFYVYWTR
jgi:hypothetical protein